MEKYLLELLESFDIETYFITRKNSSQAPCIVYNFIESPKAYSDDDEELTEYEVFFHIYAGDDIIDIKKRLMKLLKENGFQKKPTSIPIYMDDLECYEQVLQYSKIFENTEI